MIYLDPRVRFSYASYYIYGLERLFGRSKLKFRITPFVEIANQGYDDCILNLVVFKDGESVRYSIDFRDPTSLVESCYKWCDIYAKVNSNFSQYIANNIECSKVVPIPPSTAIKFNSWTRQIFLCLFNSMKSIKLGDKNIKARVLNYLHLNIARPCINDFITFPSNCCISNCKSINYIFFISTWWYHDLCKKSTNVFRKYFIKASMDLSFSNNVVFEGGFYTDDINSLPYDVQSLAFTQKKNIKEYVTNTKKSVVVFNTPSVWSCHGWKLCEYLAMGKAIITTPLSNDLPNPLVDRKHFVVVENEEDIKRAIVELIENKKFRKSLETNAKNYWMQYCSPEAVMRYILSYNDQK